MAAKKFLTAADILGAQDLAHKDVNAWGGVVRVRALTGTERSQYQAALVQMSADGKDRKIVLENSDVRLAALSMVDENGDRLFSIDQVEALGKKSAAELDKVVAAAQELSALRPEDVQEASADLKVA